MSSCSGFMDFFPPNFILQNPTDNDHQTPSSFSSFPPTCTSQDFHVVAISPMLGKRSMSAPGMDIFHQDANTSCGDGGGSGEEDNCSDNGSHMGEKKRRLNIDQVKTLEKSFELGNKLEPERKTQLAKALGLQPRQIAIWFQNRRARWKTKQLEKDYEFLKRQFQALKADHQSLIAQNHKLQEKISTLKGKEAIESINLNKETDQGSSSKRSENSSDVKLDVSTTTTPTRSSREFFGIPSNSRSDLCCERLDHAVKEESLTNMFYGVNDQSGFWPFLEQDNFN